MLPWTRWRRAAITSGLSLLYLAACAGGPRVPVLLPGHQHPDARVLIVLGTLVEGDDPLVAAHGVHSIVHLWTVQDWAGSDPYFELLDIAPLIAADETHDAPPDPASIDPIVREVRECVERAIDIVSSSRASSVLDRARDEAERCLRLVPAPVERFTRSDALAHSLLDACLVAARATLHNIRGTREEARREAVARVRHCRVRIPDLPARRDRHGSEILALLQTVDNQIAETGDWLVLEHSASLPCRVRANGRPIGESGRGPLRRRLAAGRYLIEAECPDRATPVHETVIVQPSREARVRIPAGDRPIPLTTAGRIIRLSVNGSTTYLGLVYPSTAALLRHRDDDGRRIARRLDRNPLIMLVRVGFSEELPDPNSEIRQFEFPGGEDDLEEYRLYPEPWYRTPPPEDPSGDLP